MDVKILAVFTIILFAAGCASQGFVPDDEAETHISTMFEHYKNLFRDIEDVYAIEESLFYEVNSEAEVTQAFGLLSEIDDTLDAAEEKLDSVESDIAAVKSIEDLSKEYVAFLNMAEPAVTRHRQYLDSSRQLLEKRRMYFDFSLHFVRINSAFSEMEKYGESFLTYIDAKKYTEANRALDKIQTALSKGEKDIEEANKILSFGFMGDYDDALENLQLYFESLKKVVKYQKAGSHASIEREFQTAASFAAKATESFPTEEELGNSFAMWINTNLVEKSRDLSKQEKDGTRNFEDADEYYHYNIFLRLEE